MSPSPATLLTNQRQRREMGRNLVAVSLLLDVEEGSYWPPSTYASTSIVKTLTDCQDHSLRDCPCTEDKDHPDLALLSLGHLLYSCWNVPGVDVVGWETAHLVAGALAEHSDEDGDLISTEEVEEGLNTQRLLYQAAMRAVDSKLSEG